MISGHCFSIIASDPRLNQCFAIFLSYVTNLLAYEFSVNHKYQLCKLVKQFVTMNSKVLAIGDGLNDFMMLKEADLSIGIYSNEILQVKNTCDIIVTKFSQIVDLILVHGSWNLNRFINIAFFSIYSNMLIILPIFIYQSDISVDSSYYYDDSIQLILKIFIINCAIMVIFCFDQYVERPLIGINPLLYNQNFMTKNEILLLFLKFCLISIIDSLVVYYSSFYNLRTNITSKGYSGDIYIFGQFIFINSYIIIFIKVFFYKVRFFAY